MRTVVASLVVFASAVSLVGCGEECKPGKGQLCSIAGTGLAGFSGEGKQALQADLYLPIDITIGPDQTLYVVDWNNHRLRTVSTTGIIKTLAGTGYLGDGPDGAADKADFNHPTNVVFDPEGRLVIAAWHNSKLKRIDLATGELKDTCGTGRRAYTGDNGPAPTADLDLPAGIAYDSKGNALVMDQANQVIRKIDTAGTITRFAGMCVTTKCAPGEEPVACAGTNKSACGVAADPDACKKPCAGGFGGDNGPALSARFNQPFGQAADPSGRLVIDANDNVFLADTTNHRIRKIDTQGVVTTVAGDGTAGSGPGQLNSPTDLAFGPDGTLYIADTQNSCVRALEGGGALRTVAGVCGTRGKTGDHGSATSALLDRPYGIDISPEGLLYIADTYNHRIRLTRL